MEKSTRDKEAILRKIKKIILDVAHRHGVEIDRIILFGSRARGDYKKDSDWDILVVTNEKLSRDVENELFSDIGWELVKKWIVPEIIIVDKETFNRYKNLTGFVYHWAEKEGVLIV